MDRRIRISRRLIQGGWGFLVFAVIFGILRALAEQPVFDSLTIPMTIIGIILLAIGYFLR
jgi:uncharacterized membrane protein YvlD (DUF360 family)